MNFENFDPVLLLVFLFGGIIRQGTPYLIRQFGGMHHGALRPG